MKTTKKARDIIYIRPGKEDKFPLAPLAFESESGEELASGGESESGEELLSVDVVLAEPEPVEAESVVALPVTT